MKSATKSLRFITNKKGERTGVYLTYTHYRRLMEDLRDLRVVAERRHEKTISLKSLKGKLRRKGIV